MENKKLDVVSTPTKSKDKVKKEETSPLKNWGGLQTPQPASPQTLVKKQDSDSAQKEINKYGDSVHQMESGEKISCTKKTLKAAQKVAKVLNYDELDLKEESK